MRMRPTMACVGYRSLATLRAWPCPAWGPLERPPVLGARSAATPAAVERIAAACAVCREARSPHLNGLQPAARPRWAEPCGCHARQPGLHQSQECSRTTPATVRPTTTHVSSSIVVSKLLLLVPSFLFSVVLTAMVIIAVDLGCLSRPHRATLVPPAPALQSPRPCTCCTV